MNYTNNQSLIFGVTLQDIENPLSTPHIVAEIVFIDRSNPILNPLLYKLQSQKLSTFTMMGEVLSINKEKKLIHLKSNSSVSYKYLVTASGLKPNPLGAVHDRELEAGLHTLQYAMRIGKNLTFPEVSLHRNKLDAFARERKDLSVQKLIKALSFDSDPRRLDMTARRLYEVQM